MFAHNGPWSVCRLECLLLCCAAATTVVINLQRICQGALHYLTLLQRRCQRCARGLPLPFWRGCGQGFFLMYRSLRAPVKLFGPLLARLCRRYCFVVLYNGNKLLTGGELCILWLPCYVYDNCSLFCILHLYRNLDPLTETVSFSLLFIEAVLFQFHDFNSIPILFLWVNFSSVPINGNITVRKYWLIHIKIFNKTCLVPGTIVIVLLS